MVLGPLLSEPARAVAWRRGRRIDSRTFCCDVARIAGSLPEHSYVLNVCEDRYAFAVAFVASLLRGQTNLLPPARISAVCEEIAADFPDSYCLSDNPLADLNIEQVSLALSDEASSPPARFPEIDRDHVAAIAFTSGSTGKARPNIKRWGSLETGARLAQRRFGLYRETRPTLLATVPPQHMYGLETSVLLPLVCGLPLHAGRPFFPDDVRTALAEMYQPRVLVTTPVHLRACAEAGLEWPLVELVISSTAPLSATLAARIEQIMRTRVFEIYGFSEAGSVASRRTLDGDHWLLYDGLSMSPVNGDLFVQGGHLPAAVPVHDVIECLENGGFRLLGRNSDMVNVAGKRASLGDLTQKLVAIEGVQDGAFIVPPSSEGAVTRLAAVVVAPRLEERQILSALAKRIDPVFLPRPLRKVASLPRNETGKLRREALLALLKSTEHRR